MLTSQIKIVLIKTTHPGNIGAAARAMRVMGLKNLVLVEPKFFPHGRASAMASGALDVLEKAQVFPTLAEAIADCQLVYGSTARPRHISSKVMNVRDAAKEAVTTLNSQHDGFVVDETPKPIAFVFGTERSGMSNDEIDLCQRLLTIPTENDYNSLNLGQAVQVVAYELFMAQSGLVHEPRLEPEQNVSSVASVEEMEYFYTHLEQVMIRTEFLNPKEPKHLMRRLRKLFTKANPDRNEINILRGILRACERYF